MPRPSFIIGVGGTGSWVLSWLKKDLIETHGSLEKLPVRLLLLDTAPNMAQVDSRDTQSGGYSEFIRLTDDEFIHLPAQNAGGLNATMHINNGVLERQENLAHFYDWFCGGYFPAAALNLAVGGAQFRQLGRLSLIQGLHMAGSADQVYQRIRIAMDSVARDSGNQRSVEVHVAGSFAGGTGSGLFIDVAWLVRAIARQLNIRTFLTGFFAMPSVFGQQANPERQAKAFCAWRELNRMMTVRRSEGNGFRVKWGNQPEVIFDVEEVLYDHVYLVDSMRAGARMPQDPKYGIFPAMAEAISFLIDKVSGERYVQHILQNLSNNKVQHPFRGRPTYSTFYTRAWKVPVHHQRSRYQHNFALQFLRELLDIEEYQVPDVAGNTRTEYRLRDQVNARKRVSEIFAETANDVGQTNFILQLEKIRSTPSNERSRAIDEFAGSAVDLLGIYAQMPDTPDGRAVQQQIDQYVNWQVPVFDPGRDPLEQLVSIHNNELHGPDRIGGKVLEYFGDFTVDQYRGKLYDVLEYAHNLHLQVFTQRVVNWTHRTLNTRYGLSIVVTVLRQLKVDLARIEEFMIEAQKRQPDAIATDNDARVTYQIAWQTVNNSGFIAQLLGRKANAVRSWLQAEAENVRVRRARRALQRMIETVRAMHRYVENTALANAEAMEKQLVTDSAVNDTVGLYRSLHRSLEDELDRLKLDKRLEQVIEVLGSDQIEVPVNSEDIKKLIEGTRWTVNDQMRLEISIKLDPNKPPIVLNADLRDPEQTRKLIRRILEDVASKYTPPLADERNRAAHFLPAEQLAPQLRECVPTLFEQSAAKTPQDVWTFYVRIDASEQDQKKLGDEINKLGIATRNPDPVVGSENPYKIVVFSARELLLPENFTAWETCQRGYQVSVLGDPGLRIDPNLERVRCDHLFAAEKNALALESRIARNDNLRRRLGINQLMPTLNPRIVHLLEHRERLERFLKAWMFDYVGVELESEQWQLKVPHTDLVDICSREEDMLSVIARFVFANNLRNLNHDRLKMEIEEEWTTRKRRNPQILLDQLDFECAMCDITIRLSDSIRRIITDSSLQTVERPLNSEDFKQACERQVREKVEEAKYREDVLERIKAYLEDMTKNVPLAHKVIEDLCRERNGQPLVSNAEAHLQFVAIVLRFLLEDLRSEVNDYILQRGGRRLS
jgi:predicted house-cleaning noncanonical NTP pyrophosphatase (MazG superfamily)